MVVQVEHSTCAPMILARKTDNALRICVNHPELNHKIMGERVILPTGEENLRKLPGVQIFRKLRVNGAIGRSLWRSNGGN